ncbi:nickel-dependent hydrogenase large subunit [Bradyrhizobium sediminis]|uniref:Nickel-dependent hydrogenase large subunit n=1 Tax=Bradyrhizobium sediminis TaxID=2840469 RepID=A0A975RPH2_9BRAD|nr:nickel-dependent hydrogenase large subunit [Bradyrhizobium sediminis]QWG14596.1 nickel-dependent hydrogenase large subunit [Bradyrhizobium sediminis]
MTIAGRLDINLTCRSGSSASARIASRRPHGVTRMFRGRRPAEVTSLVPLVFSVCGMAQGTAAATACERALGIATSFETRRIRDILMLAETAREHLLRVVMDWPRCMAMATDSAMLRRVMGLDQRFRRALTSGGRVFEPGSMATCDIAAVESAVDDLCDLLEIAVLGEPAETWLARSTLADIEDWAQAGMLPAQLLLQQILRSDALQVGSVSIDAVPDIDDVELAGALFGEDAERFIALPTWEGRPRETTALSRQARHPLIQALGYGCGHGIGARLVARLVELAGLPDRMTVLIEGENTGSEGDEADDACGEGVGIARSEAARGRLIHGVEIQHGVVQRYLIVAPTEWNFHPEGAAAQALALIAGSGRSDARGLADLMITAFDPCVEYSLAVH